MKAPRQIRPLQYILLLIPSLLPMGAEAALVLLFEGFDHGPTEETYTVTGAFSDEEDDYFVHVSGGALPIGLPDYLNGNGAYWAVEDVDAPENPSGVAIVAFADLAIPDFMEVTFSLKAAAGSPKAFDALDDFLIVEYRLNAGPWQTALSLQNDGSAYNGALSQDSDLDGLGEGQPLGLAFQEFYSQPLSLYPGILEVRIDAFFNADAEAVAFDDFRITVIPEPAGGAMLIGILFLLWQTKRLRSRDRPPAPS